MKHLSTIRVLLVGGAFLLSACGTNDSDSVGLGGDPAGPVAEAQLPAAKGEVAPEERASLGASPAIPQEPPECRDMFKEKGGPIESARGGLGGFGLNTHAVDCEVSD